MTARLAGRRQPCTIADARARLHDAKAFLETAETASDADVIATNAIHAAIAAADAICCLALRERSSGVEHAAAVNLLATVDSQLANALNRAERPLPSEHPRSPGPELVKRVKRK